jgi:hypothetical protein
LISFLVCGLVVQTHGRERPDHGIQPLKPFGLVPKESIHAIERAKGKNDAVFVCDLIFEIPNPFAIVA